MNSIKKDAKHEGKAIVQWQRQTPLPLLIITALLIGMIIRFIKAYKLPLVSDEAYTYVHYADKPIIQIFSAYHYPNNHLLNTLLMHFMLNFGNSGFLLRIPALIGSFVFLVAIYMILNLFADKRITAIALSLISVQPFLVDFGSLARGYSLGLAFSFLGLYIVLNLLINKQNQSYPSWKLLIAALCFILAMTAVPIFVNMIGPIFILLCLFDCIQQNPNKKYYFSSRRFFAYSKYLFLPTILITYLIYINIFTKLTHQQFVFGFHSFYKSLNNFIANDLLYGVTKSNVLIITLLGGSIFALLWVIRDGIKKRDKILCTIGIMPFLSIGFSLLEHYIFKIVYPMDRILLYLIPFQLISFVYLFVLLIDFGTKYVNWMRSKYTIYFITLSLMAATVSLNSTKHFLEYKNNSALELYEVECEDGYEDTCFKTCDAGIAKGCFSIGVMYYNGEGAKQDYNKAYDFFKKACDGEDEGGCNNLGNMYFNGQGVKQDYSKAVEFYKKACDGGLAGSCFYLGNMYYSGKYVEQNLSKAADLFKKACDGEFASGCFNLGSMYGNGVGVEKDYTKAADLFKKACDGGIGLGCNNYNILRESNGIGP